MMVENIPVCTCGLKGWIGDGEIGDDEWWIGSDKRGLRSNCLVGQRAGVIGFFQSLFSSSLAVLV
jgi:hypothetical protein